MSVSKTVTASGHPNLAAFACVGYDTNGTTVTAITYGGQAMTSAGAAAFYSGWHQYAQMFYLVNPPTGSNTLAITVSAGGGINANLVSFYGVNQTTPVRSGTYNTYTGSGANPSFTITSNTSPGDLTMSCITYGGAAGVTTNQTSDGVENSGEGSHNEASDHATTPASSVTHTWTMVAEGAAMAGFSIQAAPLTPALSFNATCPSSGYYGVASVSCEVDLANGAFNGSKTVTLSDSSNGGTFTGGGNSGQNTLAVTPASGTSFTFTYTPATTGVKPISATNNFSASNPSSFGYTGTTWVVSISGCAASGNLNAASSPACTVTVPGSFDGAHSITISDGGNGGTLTPSVGSSGVGTVTVTPASGSSFTFTYTPVLVGTKALTLSNMYGWTIPGPQLYTVSSTDVCTFTAKANGNWNSASTWTASGCSGSGHTIPQTGDSPIYITAYHVTVPAGVTAQFGSCPANNTTWDLTVAPSGGTSGWLEVAGTLWLCGNNKLNATANATPTSFGIFQIDTGGKLIWDANNGSVAYRIVPGATGGWNNLIIGTLGDTCTFSTETCPTSVISINDAGTHPILTDMNSTTDSMTFQIYGTLVKNCGSASAGCITLASDNTTGRNSYANAGLVDVEGSVFDTTSGFQNAYYSLGGKVFSLLFKESRFVNDLAGMFSLQNGATSAFTKTCSFTDNYFTATFSTGNNGWMSCSFTGNVFQGAMYFANTPSNPLGLFQRNAFLAQGNNQPLFTASLSPIQNNYFFWSVFQTSNHGVSLGSSSPDGSTMYVGNVHESSTAQTEGHCVVGSGGTPSYFRKCLDNVSAIAPNGNNSCTLSCGSIGAVSGGSTDEISYSDHNGGFGNATFQWFTMAAHSTYWSTTPGSIRSIRANIGYSPTTGATNFLVAANAPDITAINGIPNTIAYVANEGGNVLWNAASSTDWGPSNANSGCNTYGAGSNASAAYGTAYDQCSAMAPGTGDITADPKLLGLNPITKTPTRGLLQWASTLHGQAATIAGAQAALIGCPNLDWCITELVNWVRRGYQPTNVALKGKAYDGRIVGFTGSYGSGYSGTCGVTITPQDTDDLGYGAAATCTFASGVPSIQITNPGMHYRIATPAAVAITGTCTGGCVAASLAPVISPHDPGPVPMVAIGRVE
jgi:hypothetical protein